MDCLKLSYFHSAELKIISFKKVLTSKKSENNVLSGYMFGFNGQEKINEVIDIGNYVDLGERGVDARIGRLNWRTDPLVIKFPSQSPYVYAGNSPILNVDAQGKFQFSKQTLEMLKSKYPTAYMYLVQTDPSSSGNILEVAKDSRVVNIMIKNTMNYNFNSISENDATKYDANWQEDNFKLTSKKVERAFTNKSGPEIIFNMAPGGWGKGDPDLEASAGGYNPSNDGTNYGSPMQINERLLGRLENAKSPLAKRVALTNLVSVIVHEYMEYFGGDGGTGKEGSFGAIDTQRQIFGGAKPGIDPLESGEAVKMIQNKDNGILENPTFVPKIPVK